MARTSSMRKRMLDPHTATLEGCRMEPGRAQLSCSLDLSPDRARFDPDGHELEGTFRPAWTW